MSYENTAMGKYVAKDLEQLVDQARVLLDEQIRVVKDMHDKLNNRINDGDLKHASTEEVNRHLHNYYNKLYEIKNLERVKKTYATCWEPIMGHYYVVFIGNFMFTCGDGSWCDEDEIFISRSGEGLTFENAYEPSESYNKARHEWQEEKASYFDSEKWHFKRLVWGERYDSTSADFSDFRVTAKSAA